MSIQAGDFLTISSDWLTSGYWAEVDASEAKTSFKSQGKGLLLIGPAILTGTKAGSAALEKLTAVGTGQARALFGNSPLAEMVEMAIKSFPGAAIQAIPTDNEDASLTKAVYTVTIKDAPTSEGTFAIYCGSRRYQIVASPTDKASDIAASVKSAIDDDASAQVTATVSGTVVTVTTIAGGDIANSVKVDLNRAGSLGGERLPIGMTAPDIKRVTDGSGVPSLTNALVAAAETAKRAWIQPWGDTTSISATESVLLQRWDSKVMKYGHLWTASALAGYSEALTYGDAGNEYLVSSFPWTGNEPVWMAAAAMGALHERKMQVNPAMSAAFDLVPGLSSDRDVAFGAGEWSELIKYGLPEWSVDDNGKIALGRAATRYVKDTTGAGDDTWDLMTTVACVEEFAEEVRFEISSTMKNKLIVDEGEPRGANKISVSEIKQILVLLYMRIQRGRAYVENLKGFIENTLVSRDASNVGRVLIRVAPDFANQWLQAFTQIQFRKQYVFEEI